MPLTPQDFVSKWKCVTAREKPTYQEHVLDRARAVFAAYRWNPDLSDKKIIEKLLALKLERSSGEPFR